MVGQTNDMDIGCSADQSDRCFLACDIDVQCSQLSEYTCIVICLCGTIFTYISVLHPLMRYLQMNHSFASVRMRNAQPSTVLIENRCSIEIRTVS